MLRTGMDHCLPSVRVVCGIEPGLEEMKKNEQAMPLPVFTARCLRSLCCLLALAGVALDGWAQTEKPVWLDQPYHYVVIDQDVRGVLMEFGRNLSLPVVLSDQVKGRVQGHVRAERAGEFLSRISATQGLVWYYDGSALHVNANRELISQIIDTRRFDQKALRGVLDQLGLVGENVSIQLNPGRSVLSVSGPPAYIGYVQRSLEGLERPVISRGKSQGIRIFRGGAETEVFSGQG
ncbi:type III secretion protein [Pseudomonas luteola]